MAHTTNFHLPTSRCVELKRFPDTSTTETARIVKLRQNHTHHVITLKQELKGWHVLVTQGYWNGAVLQDIHTRVCSYIIYILHHLRDITIFTCTWLMARSPSMLYKILACTLTWVARSWCHITRMIEWSDNFNLKHDTTPPWQLPPSLQVTCPWQILEIMSCYYTCQSISSQLRGSHDSIKLADTLHYQKWHFLTHPTCICTGHSPLPFNPPHLVRTWGHVGW